MNKDVLVMRLRYIAPFAGLVLFILTLLGQGNEVRAQGTQTTFGKNVIQYTDFDWAFYRTDNFDIYFYQGGKELARFLMLNGEQYLKDIESKVDFPMGDRMTFIIYNSFTDYRQSNFHLDMNAINVGGKTRVTDNKAFIFFDGNHFNFVKQIKSGIAQVVLQELLYGGSLQERLQNNVLLNLPDWYADGLVRFLGDNWSSNDETNLRTGILSGKFRKFRNINDEQATLIGESLWRYINEQYGAEAVSNIIYIMRANKSLEAGYLFVLGKDFNSLYEEWYNYELKRFSDWDNNQPKGLTVDQLKKVFKKGTITGLDISMHGEYAGVVTNDHGKVNVWLVNLTNGKKKKIYKAGYRRGGDLFDYNYPLIGWNKRQNVLTVVYEKKTEPYYFHYNVEEKKKEKPQVITRIDRILSFQYNENGHTSVMSVVRHGQTDIITFDFRSQQQRNITDDIYDDLEPRFVHNGKGIVFTSNRPNVSLAKVNTTREFGFNDNMDVFYLPNYESSFKKLRRLSSGPANETMPDAYDTSYFSYLTDANGIINRNGAYLDSIFDHIEVVMRFRDTSIQQNDTFIFRRNDVAAIHLPEKLLKDTGLAGVDTAFVYRDTVYVYPLTDYAMNILNYSVNPKGGGVYELFYDNKGYQLYREPMPANIPASAVKRARSNAYVPKVIKSDNPFLVNNVEKTRIELKKDTAATEERPYFQSDFPKPRKEEANAATTGQNDIAFTRKQSGRVRFASANPYDLLFKTDYMISQLDNGMPNSPYIPYTGNEPIIYNPILSGMFKMGVSDLFSDYRLVGGIRLLASLRGAEYFMSYEDLKHRLDKKTSFFRRGEVKDLNGLYYYRATSTELRHEYSWPFSETAALRFSGFGRMDKVVYLTGEKSLLLKPSEPTYWGGGKVEYVLDNTIPRGTNLYNGTRLKFYTEFFNAFNKKNMMFTVIGGDIRHYTPLFRNMIWANRLAGASSLGSAKVVYFLGGVDNWLFPQFNQDNLVDPNEHYAYKTLATNMRGFDQNVRNGSSYAVLNSELRMPFFRFIWNRPFANQFLQNFQLIGFTDVGTAWNGTNPFSIENAYEKRVIQQDPFKITVINMRDPIVYGYGFGLRSILFGYFVRFDFAWGVENGTRQPRKFYISLTTDF